MTNWNESQMSSRAWWQSTTFFRTMQIILWGLLTKDVQKINQGW